MITHVSPEGKPLLTPIIPDQSRRAWPKHSDAKPVSYLPLRVALTRPLTTDAHLAAYSVLQHPYRLSACAVGYPDLPDGVVMVLATFNIDGHTYSDLEAWWQAERPKVMTLRGRQPDSFVDRTRSGYRFNAVLPEPIILRTHVVAAVHWALTREEWRDA
jgi:hypothetical protein